MPVATKVAVDQNADMVRASTPSDASSAGATKVERLDGADEDAIVALDPFTLGASAAPGSVPGGQGNTLGVVTSNGIESIVAPF